MKKCCALILLFALVAGLPLPALAETMAVMPETFVKNYNALLETAFASQGAPEGEQYALGTREYSDNVFTWKSAGGEVCLRAIYAEGIPGASVMTATLEFSVTGIQDAAVLSGLEAALALTLAMMDSTVVYEDLVEWLQNAPEGASLRPLANGTLVCARFGEDRTYTLTPAAGGAAASPAPQPTEAPKDDGTLLSWNGFVMTPLRYEIRSLGRDTSMRVFARIVNGTQEVITLTIEDASVDGTPVRGVGERDIPARSDTGNDPKDYCLFKDNEKDDNAGSLAIQEARRIEMTLVLQNASSGAEFYRETVSLDLRTIPDASPTYAPSGTIAPTATPSPNATPKPTYRTLKKGDSGEDVKKMQQELIHLGYLNDKADGKFGSRTGAAVQLFNEQNGFEANQIATPEMQARLFTSLAKVYSEPWMPLVIGEKTEWSWSKSGSNYINLRTQVTNNSRSRAVRGFELQLYFSDLWEDKTLLRHYDFTNWVDPGKTVFTDWFFITSTSGAMEFHVGVSKIIFADGEIREVADDAIRWFYVELR